MMWDKKPYTGKEKRRFKRVERFFVVSVKAANDDAPDWTLVDLENISEGGILFNHSGPFETGRVLKVRVKILPDKGPVECAGKVTREQKLGELDLYESAVQFTDMSLEDRALVHEALVKA